jgi:ribonucleoside-diphosphate reductase alpha chain
MKLQPSSQEIYEQKYQLKDKDGNLVDKTLDSTFERVAYGLSKLEPQNSSPDIINSRTPSQMYWYPEFLWALQNGAIPAGRILANVGAEDHKANVSTINCLVSENILDSIKDIGKSVDEAMTSLSKGSGMGFCFSLLRPKGAHVNGIGASTSGPLSFAQIHDAACKTIASAGGRRGAMMLTFHVHHPDVVDVIKAKREAGNLSQFNISLLITDEFMESVKNDSDWHLYFPCTKEEVKPQNQDFLIWKKWPVEDGNYEVRDGLTACRIYSTIKARELWDLIMRSSYDFGEPGFILIDKVNRENNNYFCEDILATNPCGEQPLPANGACLLGSVNLTHFIIDPFGIWISSKDGLTQESVIPKFDWDKFRKVVRIFTRMLDNVVEDNGLPLEKQREEIIRKRRHGMGFTGLGSALIMMKIKYGSDAAIKFTEEVTRVLAEENYKVGIELAKEKGPAPIFTEESNFTEYERAIDNNLDMFIKSNYIQKLPEEIRNGISENGCRFTHATSIAPTGTISLSIANNASNGIEPSFRHSYKRNIRQEGSDVKKQINVHSYEFLKYKELVDPNADVKNLPDYFVTADTITPKEHVDMQAAAQKWIDSSISKTVNVPGDTTFEEFKDLYMYAYEQGCKGIAAYRDHSGNLGSVMVDPESQANKMYTFSLENGETLELAGNEEVEYDGKIYIAANLAEAMK